MSHSYRKRPVTVQAFQMTKARRASDLEWPNWLNRAWQGSVGKPGTLQRTEPGRATADDELEIVTLEGVHRVSWGDYIIQGVKGELYPCKPDIFELTYEAFGEK
jgi:hypothetical protein